MATDRGALSKVVSDQIRGQILDGKLKPGERLVEDRLSAELGVSRVPVREALRGLSMEGLVRLGPKRGARGARVTPAGAASPHPRRRRPEDHAGDGAGPRRGGSAAGGADPPAGGAPPRPRDRRRA